MKVAKDYSDSKHMKKNQKTHRASGIAYLEPVFIRIPILILLIAWVYSAVPGYGLTNWDDEGYILNNALLKLPFPAWKAHFTTFLMGNYHPLTTFSLHLDMQLWEDHVQGWHLTNIILHGINTLLLLVWLQAVPKLKSWALPVAILFAIHPMHVESVAWVSERKDVLYTLFYFAALLMHAHWLTGKIKFNIAAPAILLLFILSALSKGMAVTLPITLIGMHFLHTKPKQIKVWILYGALLIIAILFGVIAIQAQQSTDSIKALTDHAILLRPVYALYALSGYIANWILPISLSNFYPYPDLSAPLTWLMITITPVLLISLWRMQKWNWAMTWGCLFFLWHLLPVLQLLPVGEAILADRYSYIAGIGISILIFNFAEQRIANQTIKMLLFMLWAGGLTYGAKLRTHVWKDSLTLWNNMIQQYPDGYFVAYNNRAIALQKLGRTKEALQDYSRAITMFEPYRDAWYNRGSLYADLQNHSAAISDLSRAIQLDGNFKLAFYNRANSYASLGKMDSAQMNYERTLQLDPSYAEAWTNLGNVYGVKGMHKEAEFAFGKSIEYQPENAYAYNNRALARASQGKSDAAMLDFDMAIQIHQAAGNTMGMQEALANKRIYFPEP